MPGNPTKPALDIETLKKKHKELEKQKTTEEANLTNAETALKTLKQEAMQKYGTENLAELRQKLREMEAENERKRAEYQTHLETIQTKLEEVKKQFSPEPGEEK